MLKQVFKSLVAVIALTLLASASIASAVKLSNASHARALARIQPAQVLELPRVVVVGQRELAPLARNGKGQSTVLR